MKAPKEQDVKRGITVLWETLQCPICLELMSAPVSTKCDHHFCKHCIMQLFRSSKQKEASCPVCKNKITRRSLQESAGFQKQIAGLKDIIQAYEQDTGTNYLTGMPLQRQQTPVTEATLKKAPCHVDASCPAAGPDSGENEEISPSTSISTVAAMDDFAMLMSLVDSSPFKPTSDKEKEIDVHNSPPGEASEPAVETEMLEIVEKSTARPRNRGKKRISHLGNPSSDLVLIPEEMQQLPVRRSLRNSKGTDPEPDIILDQKNKQTQERVTEWLLKIPPAEANSQVEKPAEEDTVHTESPDSPAGNSSTISTAQIVPDVSAKRVHHAKCLEEQVFGVVYGRGRRRSSSIYPQPRVFVDPPVPPAAAPEGTRSPIKVTKRKKSNILTPADFVKRSVLEDQLGISDLSTDVILKENTLTDSKGTDRKGLEKEEEPIKLPENNNNEGQGGEDSPAFEVVLRQPERTSKKRKMDTWQAVDGDLQEQTKAASDSSTEKKSAGRKRGKNATLDKGKMVKVPKPLVMVSASEGESNSTDKPKVVSVTEEIHAEIENYPSSEEPGTPLMRTTRRSKRLKGLIEEVQGSRKKACPPQNIKANVPSTDMVKQYEDARASTTSDDTTCQNRNVARLPQRNGCVVDSDIGGIEKMESSESMSIHLRTQEAVTPVKESVAEVPNSGSPREASDACSVAMVPDSTSPTKTAVQNPASENDSQEKPPPSSTLLERDQMETSANQSQSVEMEEEDKKNDSELDTEQLLKSFKAARRKSFHLGSATSKTRQFISDKSTEVNCDIDAVIKDKADKVTEVNCPVDSGIKGATEQDFIGTKEHPRLDTDKVTEVNCHVDCGTKGAKDQEVMGTKEHSIIQDEVLLETQTSSCADLIPPSHSPSHKKESRLRARRGLKKSSIAKLDQVVVDSSIPDTSGNTQDGVVNGLSDDNVSSVLTPNNVAKSQTESPNVSVLHQAADSGLLFPAFCVSEEDTMNRTPACSKQLDSILQETGEINQCSVKCSILPDSVSVPIKPRTEDIVEHMANTETSLTPDDLIPPVVQMTRQAVEISQVNSNHSGDSPVKTSTRTRRAHRLQSSSESDISVGKDNLPTSAQTSACLSAEEQESSDLLLGQVQGRGDSEEQNGHGRNGTHVAASATEQQGHPHDVPSPDYMISSQASVDLFGTPEDYPVHSSCLVSDEECDESGDHVIMSNLVPGSLGSAQQSGSPWNPGNPQKRRRVGQVISDTESEVDGELQEAMEIQLETNKKAHFRKKKHPNKGKGKADLPTCDMADSVASSQSSCDYLATQQKLEMKEELARMEKMMAALTEALKAKEGASSQQAGVTSDLPLQLQSSRSAGHVLNVMASLSPQGHDLHVTLPCGQDTRRLSARESDVERNPSPPVPSGSGRSDGHGPTLPGPPKHDGNTEPARQLSRQPSRASGAERSSQVKPADQTLQEANGSLLSARREAADADARAASVSSPALGRHRAPLVLVSSGLGSSEQVMVKKFAKKVGGQVRSQVTAEATHIIMRTDERLVCERTLKYFQGIAGRKWLVSFQWIAECFRQGELLDESPYEVRGDVVNGPSHQGPMKARTAEESKSLMKGYKICFQGPFTDMTTDQLEWMVEHCGASVVKDPFNLDCDKTLHQLVIVQSEQWAGCSPLRSRSTVVTRSWLLDSVATYTLQDHLKYKL